MGNRGAVDTSSSGRASTARGQFRDRLEALVLAQHTGHRALFPTTRAEVEYNGLARSQDEMALPDRLSAGDIAFVAFTLLLIVLALLLVVLALLLVVFALLLVILALLLIVLALLLMNMTVLVAIVLTFAVLIIVVRLVRRVRVGGRWLAWLGAAALGTRDSTMTK